MGDFNKLKVEPKEIDCDGEKFMIYPLKTKDQYLMMDMKEQNKKEEAYRKIIRSSLRMPEITNEQIDEIPLKYSNLIMEVIMELNGMEEKAQKLMNQM